MGKDRVGARREGGTHLGHGVEQMGDHGHAGAHPGLGLGHGR